MRLQPSAVVLLFVVLFLSACQPVAEQTEADVAAIEALVEEWHAARETGDVAAMVALRTNDVVRMPPGAPTSRGKQAVEDFFRGLFEQFWVEGAWPVEGTEEIVVADGWAFHLSEYMLKLIPKAGGEPSEMRGNIMVIFRQQSDGSWKIAREIWNQDDPPPSMK